MQKTELDSSDRVMNLPDMVLALNKIVGWTTENNSSNKFLKTERTEKEKKMTDVKRYKSIARV